MSTTHSPAVTPETHVFPGVPIVSDTQFQRDGSRWSANCYYLLINNAVLLEGVDIYNLRQSLTHAITTRSGIMSQSLRALDGIVRFNEDLPEIGLVLIGGARSSLRQSCVVQAVAHQLPQSDILVVHGPRANPPQYQDRNLLHVQTWSADDGGGYVIPRNNETVSVRNNETGSDMDVSCTSPECRFRGLSSDPSLVKVSAFVHSLETLRFVGACISPSATVQNALRSRRNVLFWGESNLSLACHCLSTLHSTLDVYAPVCPILSRDNPHYQEHPRPRRFLNPWGYLETYSTLMQSGTEQGLPPESIAEEWTRAWPTNMTNDDNAHRFCGCLRSRMQFDDDDSTEACGQEESTEVWGDNAPWMHDPDYVHPQARAENDNPQ